MNCEYCKNTSGRTDSYGGCVTCGAPLTKNYDAELEYQLRLAQGQMEIQIQMQAQQQQMAWSSPIQGGVPPQQLPGVDPFELRKAVRNVKTIEDVNKFVELRRAGII